jgi:hypothetical protein
MTSSTRLLTAGMVAAVVIRGALFVLSFGVFGPALGVDGLAGSGSILLDAGIAVILLGGAATVIAMANRPDQRRRARIAHVLGWAYVIDNLIYVSSIATFYATSSAVDGSPWFASVPALLQVPLVVLSIAIVRSTAWAMSRPGADRVVARPGGITRL